MKTNTPVLSLSVRISPSRIKPKGALRYALNRLMAAFHPQMSSAVTAFGTLLWSIRALQAVPACPVAATVTQPDGLVIKIQLRGDELAHWHEDEAGFTILKDAPSGQWRYAIRDARGELVPGNAAVGRDNPKTLGLTPRLMPAGMAAQAALAAQERQPDANVPEGRAPRIGGMKNLVVLVQFSDLMGTHTRAEFDALFNTLGYTTDGARGSVKDYYREVSYNQLTVDSVVTDWVTLSHPYAYYGANASGIAGKDMRPREMVQEALALLEARGFDFSTLDADGDGWVDGLTIIHAGRGEEWGGNNPDYIWSHKWEMSGTVTYDGKSMRNYHTESERRGFDGFPSTWGITRIGVICHETGHFLGLPDLYDTTVPPAPQSRGIGDFCLMAFGSWNGDFGSQPAHLSAWCKTTLGWVKPVVVSGSGTYTAKRVEDNQVIHRLNGAFPSTQYFLVENRQGQGFDASLPGTARGLLIWHVDETRPGNMDRSHYLVDLEEASGTQELEQNTSDGDDRDYYRLGNNTSFTSTSNPNNLSYSGTPLGLSITAVSAAGSVMTFMVNVAAVSLPDALDTPGWNWSVGGTAAWIGQTLVNHDGVDAGASGTITHNKESWMETTFTGPGTVGFWWKVSSEADHDFLRVRVDGTDAGAISGEVDWQQRTLSIGSGAHTIRWRYVKNGSVSTGQDQAWVDQVTFTPGLPQPVIHVDWRYTGSNPDGSLAKPYRTVAQGHAAAVTARSTMKIRYGNYLVAFLVNKPLLMEPYDGPVLLGGPLSGGFVPSGQPGTPSPAPMLSAPKVQADGSFALPFSGVAWQRYQVLATTNLVNWEVWKDFVAETDAFEIVDEDAAVTPHRFFRVVVP